MEDDAITLAQTLLEERNLVTYTKLYIFTYVKVSLGTGLQVEVVPNTILHTETDVVESLIGTCTFIIIEERTLTIAIDGMIAIVIVARGIIQIYTPIDHGGYNTHSELIIK